MTLQLYCVTYEVHGDFEDILRNSFVWANSAVQAQIWVKRNWWRNWRRRIDVADIQVVQPIEGGLVATVWAARK